MFEATFYTKGLRTNNKLWRWTIHMARTRKRATSSETKNKAAARSVVVIYR